MFRPIALTEYFEAAFLLCQRNAATYEETFELLNTVELDIARKPWLGLMWDGTKIINRASKTVIRLLLLHMAASSVMTPKEREKLVRDYASSVNISVEDSEEFITSIRKI